MANVKHRIFVGHSEPVAIDDVFIIPETPPFSFDSTEIKMSSTFRSFDEN